MNTPELVHAARAELAEGPVWHENALWWVNIVSGTLNRFDPATGYNTSRATGGFLSAAAPTSDGRWIIARQLECALLNWQTGQMNSISLPEQVPFDHRFNDGKCDPAGSFWIGTMSLELSPNEAGLFRLGHDGKIQRVLSDLTISNGLVWSPQGDRFFHIDTPTREVRVYDFEPTQGTLANGRTLLRLTENDGFPDGMTIDVEGNLWIALWQGGAVIRVDGRSGRVVAKYPLPVSQISACTFGGDGLRTLYITTAWENLSLQKRIAEPLAGSLFALRTDTQGLPATVFDVRQSFVT